MNKTQWNKAVESYYEDTLSPLKDAVENPLFDDLVRVKDREKKSAIDLGCGLGELESFLSRNFKEVKAIDFSNEMVARAREKNKVLRNVEVEVGDLRELGKFRRGFDVAVAVNSIISPKPEELDKIFSEVNRVLKKNGLFFGVFPSMEVYAYQALLLKQKGKSLGEYTDEEIYNFPLGVIDFEGKQKAFYRFELLWRLEKAGFRNVKIGKVFYSWEEFKKAGQGYFPGEKLPWDWYVSCER